MLPFFPRIIDGGTGTEMERLGAPMHGVAWSAEVVLSHPDMLRRVHRSFLEAGADLLIANSFGAGLHTLQRANLGEAFERVNADAVRLAAEAIAAENARCALAGAISTTTFSGALDDGLLPQGEAAITQYARQAGIQARAGAQLIILEMMRDIKHTALALEGALRAGLPVWVGFSCQASPDGEVFLLDTDIPLAVALEELPLHLAHAVGVMHTLLEHAPAAVATLKKHWSGPTFAYPHAGHFEMPHWVFQNAITPQAFAHAGASLFASGVDAVGGCCGITPAHIRALREVASHHSPHVG